ncbi:hypothetical protein L0Y49_04725, partial [bacterium]|nr:hypothetical protein [bacterium]
ERLKISTIFFAFLAAFSPRTMNSRYANSFFTSSSPSAIDIHYWERTRLTGTIFLFLDFLL